jgi:hypothetical protein
MRYLPGILVLLFSIGPASGQVKMLPPTDAEVDETLKQLASKNSPALKRLEALDWINLRRSEKKLEKAIPALERAIRTDSDKDVRLHAIRILTHMPLIRERPCPGVLIEAMTDPVEDVRWEASASVGTFKEVAPEAVPAVLRGMKNPNPQVRAHLVFPLAKLARKDAKLVAVIREATSDSDWDLRDCAYFALYRATDKLDDVLPYMVRERGAQEDARLAGRQESLEEKKLRENRNLRMIGAGAIMVEWLDTRPDDVSRVLTALLDDKTAADRRAAALFLATFAIMNQNMRNKPPQARKEFGVSDYFSVNSPEDKAARTAQLRKQLSRLGLLGRLERLAASDPEPAVQRAAEKALRALESHKAGAKRSSPRQP